MTKHDFSERWRGVRRATVLIIAAVPACGSSSTEPPPPPPPPPPYENPRVLPDTIAPGSFVDSLRALMPGRDSNGYDPPTADERLEMVAIMSLARAGDVAHADSLAHVYRYDVEATVDAVHNDTLVVIVERAPIQRGWGTYILRRSDVAADADVHINHPVFDTNTPRVAAGLYDACRCRALLMAGTHRYANGGDESDMARSTTSVFQGIHESLAGDADMVVSVHGFARGNYDDPIGSSDAVLSLGANANGDLEANDAARNLRDALVDAGFIAGLVADDAGYDQLTASPNPQGRYSNNSFGHGRWIHIEMSREVRTNEAAWSEFTAVVAQWLEEPS